MAKAAKCDFDLTVDNTRILFQFGPNFLHHRYIWDAPCHCNVNYELHILLRGSCVAEVAEDTLSLSAGDALIIAPGVYHVAQVDSGSFERFTITFSPLKSSLTSVLQKVVDPYARMDTTPEIRTLCSSIIREYGGQALYQEDLLRCQLGQLLVLLLRQLAVLENDAVRIPPRPRREIKPFSTK